MKTIFDKDFWDDYYEKDFEDLKEEVDKNVRSDDDISTTTD